VHEAAHTRVDRGNHRRRTHRTDIDLHPNLGRFVDDGLEDLNFLEGRPWFGRERDLTGMLDALGGPWRGPLLEPRRKCLAD
jgi:hypothetical protein